MNQTVEVDYREETLEAAIYDRVASIFVRIWEPAEYEQSLLCIPGIIGTSGDFSVLARHLAKLGIKVVALDLIGRGKSTYLGDVRYYNLQSHLRCIRAVKAKTIDGPYSIVATSAGGIQALFFRSLEKVGPRKIILNDVPLAFDEVRIGRIEAMSEKLRQIVPTEEEAIERIREGHSAIIFGSEAIFREFAKNCIQRTEDGYRYAIDPVLVEAFGSFAGQRFDLIDMIAAADCDVLCLYGAGGLPSDRDAMLELQSRFPHLTYRGDFESGHPISLTCEKEINVVAEFLSEN